MKTKKVGPSSLKLKVYVLINSNFNVHLRHNLYFLHHSTKTVNTLHTISFSSHISILYWCRYLQQTVSSTIILLLDYYLRSPGGRHVYFDIIVISLFFIISFSSVDVLTYNHIIPRYPPSRRRMPFFFSIAVFPKFV
jgi:hypothetical protein